MSRFAFSIYRELLFYFTARADSVGGSDNFLKKWGVRAAKKQGYDMLNFVKEKTWRRVETIKKGLLPQPPDTGTPGAIRTRDTRIRNLIPTPFTYFHLT